MAKATKVGVVINNKMDKTAVVSVERLVRHPLYKRTFKKTSTFVVHDEDNRLKVGDQVRIVECRPLSKRKRWRLLDVVKTVSAEQEEPSIGQGAALAEG